MRNLLPMETAPRDGTEFIGYSFGKPQIVEWFGRKDNGWFISAACMPVAPTGWLPLPGTILPMSTAWRDGRRIQVAVELPNGKVRWEHVEWFHDGHEGAWTGAWMMVADPNECIEDNWRGWWPTPGKE